MRYQQINNVDENNIFVVGYSQGALFAQNLAIKLHGTFKAIAVVAGAMSKPLYDEGQPEKGTSVIAIHGSDDTILPYNGASGGLSALVSAEDAMQFWATTDNGNPTPRIVNKDKFIKFIYNENSSKESVLYKIKNGKHVWPKSKLNATDKIVEFFKDKLHD